MSDVSKLNFGDSGGDRNVKDAVAREKLTVVDPSAGSGLIQFGVDANGNYGYKKVGADTVIPFSSGGGGSDLGISFGIGGAEYNDATQYNYFGIHIDEYDFIYFRYTGILHIVKNAEVIEQINCNYTPSTANTYFHQKVSQYCPSILEFYDIQISDSSYIYQGTPAKLSVKHLKILNIFL